MDGYIRDLFPVEKRRIVESVDLLEGSYLECPTTWQVPEQRYSYHRIYYIDGGTAFYEMEGETGLLKAGHLYLFPSKARAYSIHQDPSDRLRVLWCHIDMIPDITNPLIDVDGSSFPVVRELIDVWHAIAEMPSPGNEIQALITVILCLIDRITGFQFTDRAFEGVERYISEHLCDKPDVAALAAHFGYTRAHFTRRFKEAFGLSPGDYLRVVRMSRASVMLLAGQALEDICAKIGYEDKKAFTRAFGKYYGVSPSEYRKRYGQSQ